MWLIDRKTYAVEYYHDPPEYLILSHTWGHEEVTFQDMKDLRTARTMNGFRKIKGICEVSLYPEVRHAWVDTCCIDKSSSAELTESINSMFRWYKEATCCVVYLEDLDPAADETSQMATWEGLQICRWFSRGWTLQELIAPSRASFFDKSWRLRGTKVELVDALSRITRIDKTTLLASDNLHNVLIAERMSWAADRETTRVEDKAYSLLGIFDVHMPLIYGEREKAFLRLQEVIVQRINNDSSIFAWGSYFDDHADDTKSQDGEETMGYNIFAETPSLFRSPGRMVRINDSTLPTPNILLTNKGVEILSSLGHHTWYNKFDISSLDFLLLNCRDTSAAAQDEMAAIAVRKTPDGFVRISTKLYSVNPGRLLLTDIESSRLVRDVAPLQRSRLVAQHRWVIETILEPKNLQCHFETGFYPEHRVLAASSESCKFFTPVPGDDFTAMMQLTLFSNHHVSTGSGMREVVFILFGLKYPGCGLPTSPNAKHAFWTQVISEKTYRTNSHLLDPDVSNEWSDPDTPLHNPYYLAMFGQRLRSSTWAPETELIVNLGERAIRVSVELRDWKSKGVFRPGSREELFTGVLVEVTAEDSEVRRGRK